MYQKAHYTAANVLQATVVNAEFTPVQGAQFSTPPSIYDSRAHLLHGVLHLNGFGHLLRVNGGLSNILSAPPRA